MKKRGWWVYVAECANGSLYTGITNDLAKRLEAHNTGRGGSYTRSHRPIRFVHAERARGKSQALKRELEIKSWTAVKKRKFLKEGRDSSAAFGRLRMTGARLPARRQKSKASRASK